jgi:hypothetical protein
MRLRDGPDHELSLLTRCRPADIAVVSTGPTSTRTTPKLVVLHDLRRAWRAASAAHQDAWRAWCDGNGSYERVIAALDREEAAARALVHYQRGGTG